MTLSIRLKNMGPRAYAVRVERDGGLVLRLQPGEEAEAHTWAGSPLLITEEASAESQAVKEGR